MNIIFQLPFNNLTTMTRSTQAQLQKARIAVLTVSNEHHNFNKFVENFKIFLTLVTLLKKSEGFEDEFQDVFIDMLDYASHNEDHFKSGCLHFVFKFDERSDIDKMNTYWTRKYSRLSGKDEENVEDVVKKVTQIYLSN